MHGIVSILPQPYYAEVEQIWDDLEKRHGLKGVRVTPYPHFSWEIGEDYPLDRLEEAFRRLSRQIRPFPVRTTGLGLFTGSQPVIFLPVVKTEALVEAHKQIWQALHGVGRGISEYYSPSNWVPHISLAYGDVTPENIGPVMQTLAFCAYNWEFQVENLAFIYEPNGTVGEAKLKVELAQTGEDLSTDRP